VFEHILSKNLGLEFWAETPRGETQSLAKMGTETLAAGEQQRYTVTFTPEEEGGYILHVYLYDGIVILEGTVDLYWKRWKAENLLSDLTSVKEIKNHLTVVPSDRFVDKNIASDIENALKRSLYVQAEDVAVKVEDGKVTLSGTVPTYYSRMKAFDAAINTAGVTDVNNYIVVA